MASGKSVIGAALANHLQWRHVDLDKEIERYTGKTIAEIFASQGEAAFRQLERELTPSTMGDPGVVFSPGGGWITNQGLLQDLPPDTLSVYLRASPKAIIRRLGRRQNRPLLAGLNRRQKRERVESLLAEREPLYRQAHLIVETDDRIIEDIVTELSTHIRSSIPTTGAGNG